MKKKIILSILSILVCANFEYAQSSIPSFVISSGGMNITGSTYNINCTIGQSALGMSGNTTNTVFSGFWYSLNNMITFIAPVQDAFPDKFSLEQNFPNPFNPATTIRISVREPSLVVIKLYDILGAEVSTLLSGEMKAGVYDLQFNANELASGVYIYRMSATSRTGSFTETRKMNLLK